MDVHIHMTDENTDDVTTLRVWGEVDGETVIDTTVDKFEAIALGNKLGTETEVAEFFEVDL